MEDIERSDKPQPELEAVGQLTDDPQELKAKAVSGFGWATIQQIFGRVMSFSVNIILARLLLPEDFGTVATLGVFTAIATSLVDAGFGSSLSRSERVDDTDLSTIFYYNVGMSVVMYALLFLAAPLIADYFHNPVLIPVLRVLMISLLVNALGGIHGILLFRQMFFRQDLYIQLGSWVVSAGVGIVMAYLGYKYWAIVGMTMTQAVIRNAMLWFFISWRPKLLFSKERLRHHFGYGSRIVLVGLLNTIYNNLTTIIIGRNFSMTIQGFYGNANGLQQVPVSTLSDPINKVTYPILVRVQNDPERLRAIYQRSMRLLFQISTPMMVALIVMAYPLYDLFFGEKWLEAVPYFQILCISGILFPINSYNINLLQVTGRANLHLRLDIVRKIVGVAGLFVGLAFGIYGLIWSMAIVQVVYLFVNSHYSGRLIDFSLWTQLRELLPFALMSAVAGGVLWLADGYLLSGLPNFLHLACGSILMALVYLALACLFARKDVHYLWGLIQHYVLRRG